MSCTKTSAVTEGLALCVAANACATSALATVVPVFLTSDIHASYFEASFLMVAGAIASSFATYGFGRIGDVARWRYAVAIGSALCGLIGALILAFAKSYWGFLLVFASLLAVAGSLFSQLMALTIIHAKSSTAIIRAVASGGWVVGPALGGLIASWQSPMALFLAVGAIYGLLAVAIGAMALRFPRPPAMTKEINPPSEEPNRKPTSILLVVSILAAIHFLLWSARSAFRGASSRSAAANTMSASPSRSQRPWRYRSSPAPT